MVTGFNPNEDVYDNMQFGIYKCTACVSLLAFIYFYVLIKIKNSDKIRK